MLTHASACTFFGGGGGVMLCGVEVRSEYNSFLPSTFCPCLLNTL